MKRKRIKIFPNEIQDKVEVCAGLQNVKYELPFFRKPDQFRNLQFVCTSEFVFTL